VSKELLGVVNTKSTELLFLALFLKLLKPGGRAAVIVPDGVLFKNNKANKEIKRIIVEEHKLEGVISLPSGVFKPYAGVSTAILLFTKTNSGGTNKVWFYDLKADGWSLDDSRTPLLSFKKLGPKPKSILTINEHEKNNLPDVLIRWQNRENSELKRLRSEQSFVVDKEEIVKLDYNLSLSRYQEITETLKVRKSSSELISELNDIESEIQKTFDQLKEKFK